MMRTIALVLACSACASQARRVQPGIDSGNMMYDPIAASLQMLQDPDAMAQITDMMRDPRFQEEVRQAMNTNPMVAGLPQEIVAQMDPQVLAEQMEAMMQDPEFMAKAKRAAKEMEQAMQDPAFLEQANRMAEQMRASVQQQRRSNALTTLLLALNPAAARVGSAAAPALARSQARQLIMEDEPSSSAVTIGAAAIGGALGVVLTGELTTAALFSAAAAYATTLDNGFGSATKSAGNLAAKAYDKTVEINEQYDVLPKAKSAADTVVTVADNLNKNYGLTDKVDEKLKLSATLDKATDKIDELKDSLTSKVDDLKKSATESDK
jgi:hypothetical protein